MNTKRTALSLRSAPTSASTLLSRIIQTPNLPQIIQSLPNPIFSALIRHIGVEDAGELVALATTQQIISAFDEDLFVNKTPGQRETFDAERFATWLEVLLESGDTQAALRLAQLSEDFLVLAFSHLITVLDHDALRDRLYEDNTPTADTIDKILESSLIEEIDGYLLVAKVYDGWDALLAVVLALDRDYRTLLVQILDRCAALTADALDDLDALATLLSSSESLAEDVEAERDARRSLSGFIEPRAAKNFLTSAKQPLQTSLRDQPRDPIARMYFRDLSNYPHPTSTAPHLAIPATKPSTDTQPEWIAALPSLLNPNNNSDNNNAKTNPPMQTLPSSTSMNSLPIEDALKNLQQKSPTRFAIRTSELAFLANVLLSAATLNGRRLRLSEASQSALFTVALGAALEANDTENQTSNPFTSADALCDMLYDVPADLLFRRASSALATQKLTPDHACFVHSPQHLNALLLTIFK